MMIEIYSTKKKPLTELEIFHLHEIMVAGYERTEEEIWGKNYVRLFLTDFKLLVEQGVIYVAYYNNIIAGCIHIYPKDKMTYGFSLLAVDEKYLKKGIGKKLIETAEEIAIKNKAKFMKIEILRVKDIDVQHKVILANFYEKLGYKYVHSKDCSCLIPEWKYKLLVKPSNFDFYTKNLI